METKYCVECDVLTDDELIELLRFKDDGLFGASGSTVSTIRLQAPLYPFLNTNLAIKLSSGENH